MEPNEAGGKTNILQADTQVQDGAALEAIAKDEATRKEAAIKRGKLAALQMMLFQRISQVQPTGRVGFMTAYNFVEQFHAVMETRRKITETPDLEVFERRLRLVDEEVNKEFVPMMARLAAGQIAWSLENRAEMLDHIVDCVYVLLGTASEIGLPFDDGFDIVHQANMAKFKDGIVKNEFGKLMKPEGWIAPNAFLFEIIKQHWEVATLTDSVEHKKKAEAMAKAQEGSATQAGNQA